MPSHKSRSLDTFLQSSAFHEISTSTLLSPRFNIAQALENNKIQVTANNIKLLMENQGYAYAMLIEYISHQYATSTGKSNYGFETLYHEFCPSYGPQPFTSLTKDYESLSADVRRLMISDAASQQDKSVKFVLHGKTDALIGLVEGFGLNTLSVENGFVISKRSPAQ